MKSMYELPSKPLLSATRPSSSRTIVPEAPISSLASGAISVGMSCIASLMTSVTVTSKVRGPVAVTSIVIEVVEGISWSPPPGTEIIIVWTVTIS